MSGGHEMLRRIGVSPGWCMRVESASETVHLTLCPGSDIS